MAFLAAGCAFSSDTTYVAGRNAGNAGQIGATAIAVQTTGGFISGTLSKEKIRAAVADVVRTVPGASEAQLPPAPEKANQSDYELLLAARQASARTLCVVTIHWMGSQIGIGLGVPPYYAKSEASYNVRLLDVATGQLLAESDRRDSTFDPFFEPPAHSLADLQRGFKHLLRANIALTAKG